MPNVSKWLTFCATYLFLSGRDKTCGKTKHEIGYSRLYLHKDDSNEPFETTTDVFIFHRKKKQFVVVVEVWKLYTYVSA